MEIKADVIMKATKVEGIYDADPMLVKDAKKFEQISYMDVLKLGLGVMDATAISLCQENNLPIIVFNLNAAGNIRRVVSRGEDRIDGDRVEQSSVFSRKSSAKPRHRSLVVTVSIIVSQLPVGQVQNRPRLSFTFQRCRTVGGG